MCECHRNSYSGIPIRESIFWDSDSGIAYQGMGGHDVCSGADCGRGMLGKHVATGNAPEIPLNLQELVYYH